VVSSSKMAARSWREGWRHLAVIAVAIVVLIGYNPTVTFGLIMLLALEENRESNVDLNSERGRMQSR
jgi:hypothetical protein